MAEQLSGVFTVTLFRDGPFTPWGFRLQGGADHNRPLQIQRVSSSDHHTTFKSSSFLYRLKPEESRHQVAK
jgi:hypothetical protein